MLDEDTAAIICSRSYGRESVTESIREKCAYCNEEVFLSRTSLRRIGNTKYICCCDKCIGNLPKKEVIPLSKEQMEEIMGLGISREFVAEHIENMKSKLGQKI